MGSKSLGAEALGAHFAASGVGMPIANQKAGYSLLAMNGCEVSEERQLVAP